MNAQSSRFNHVVVCVILVLSNTFLGGCAAPTLIGVGIGLAPLVPRTPNKPIRVPAESSTNPPAPPISNCQGETEVQEAIEHKRACLPLPFRTSAEDLQEKRHREIVRHHPSEVHPDFTLHTVEFDDQGWFWNRSAFEQAMTCIAEEAVPKREKCPEPTFDPQAKNQNSNVAAVFPNSAVPRSRGQNEMETRGAIIVVFVHGWEHNCDVCDDNLTCFRDTLTVVANQERASAARRSVPPRRVIGVYAAWRGKSLVVPGYTKVDFWWRKDTAHKIGHGQATELFTRLDQIHQEIACRETDNSLAECRGIAPSRLRIESPRQRSLLVYVGHSFGAALLYSSLSSVLTSRMNEAQESSEPIRGMGDLAVLVNPAFEALLYETFDRRTRDGHFHNEQSPQLMVVSSAGDLATRVAFPFGRLISSIAEGARRREQWGAALKTVGNYKRDWTNTLDFHPNPDAEESAKPLTGKCRCKQNLAAYDQRITDEVLAWEQAAEQGGPPFHVNQPQRFGQVTLNPYGGRALDSHSPFLVLHADTNVIKDHGDIFNQHFITFLIEFVSVQDLNINMRLANAKAKAP